MNNISAPHWSRAKKERIVNRSFSFLLVAIVIVAGLMLHCPPLFVTLGLSFLFVAAIYLFEPGAVRKALFKYKEKGVRFAVGGFAALLLFVLMFVILKELTADNCNSPYYFQVVVHDVNGHTSRPLRNRGKVEAYGLPEVKRTTIDENGEAHFEHIPQNSTLTFNIVDAGQWKPVEKATQYQPVNHGKLYLQIKLDSVNIIEGSVMDEDRMPLEGVVVSYRSSRARTDSTGKYQLNISEPEQQEVYHVDFYKKGYEAVSETIQPPTHSPFSTLMKRRSSK